jgi:hypothetical protein
MKRRWWILGGIVTLAVVSFSTYFFLVPRFPPQHVVCVDQALEEITSVQSGKMSLPESFIFTNKDIRHFRCASVLGFMQFEMSGLDETGHVFYIHAIAGGTAASGADSLFDFCYQRDGRTITQVRYSGRRGTQSIGTCSYDETLLASPNSNYRYDAIGFNLRQYFPL